MRPRAIIGASASALEASPERSPAVRRSPDRTGPVVPGASSQPDRTGPDDRRHPSPPGRGARRAGPRGDRRHPRRRQAGRGARRNCPGAAPVRRDPRPGRDDPVPRRVAVRLHRLGRPPGDRVLRRPRLHPRAGGPARVRRLPRPLPHRRDHPGGAGRPRLCDELVEHGLDERRQQRLHRGRGGRPTARRRGRRRWPRAGRSRLPGRDQWRPRSSVPRLRRRPRPGGRDRGAQRHLVLAAGGGRHRGGRRRGRLAGARRPGAAQLRLGGAQGPLHADDDHRDESGDHRMAARDPATDWPARPS